MSDAARWFASLSTAAKLLLILSAALLPVGLALVWLAQSDIREANSALRGRTEDQAEAAARAINEAMVKVSQQERDGDFGSAEADREKRLSVAAALSLAVKG